MTLVSLPSPIAFPGNITVNGGPSITTIATLDAAGEYVSFIFSAREDMLISHVGFRAGTVTNSPTCTVSIEGVDGSGLPDGAATFGGSAGTTATISSNTWVLTALGGSATVPKGAIFCVKIQWGGVATSTVIIQQLSSIVWFAGALPYGVYNTGTPTKTAIGGSLPFVGLGSSSTTFYQVPGIIPANAFSASAFNNTSSAKRGMKFVPPMNCRAVGIRWYNGTSVGNCNVALYDDAGAELSSSSVAYDGDQNSASANMTTVYFDNPVTLTAGTAYRAAIEPTSATNITVAFLTIPSSDYFTGCPGGANCVYATYVASSWTDSTTQIAIMEVMIDQVDNGAGTGGGGGQRVISG